MSKLVVIVAEPDKTPDIAFTDLPVGSAFRFLNCSHVLLKVSADKYYSTHTSTLYHTPGPALVEPAVSAELIVNF